MIPLNNSDCVNLVIYYNNKLRISLQFILIKYIKKMNDEELQDNLQNYSIEQIGGEQSSLYVSLEGNKE